MHRVLVVSFLVLLGLPTNAQVTLRQIMQDPDWIGNAPQRPYWSHEGESIYYWMKRDGSRLNDLYRITLDGATQRVGHEQRAEAGAPGGDWSDDRTRHVFTREGDVYLRDLSTETLRQLTRTTDRESGVFFLDDEFGIAFQRGGDVYVRDLTSGLEYQPFDVRAQDDPAKEDDEKYIEAQQDRLFEIIRLREQRREESREHENSLRERDPGRVDPPWFLGKKHRVTGRFLSPTGEHLVVRLSPKSQKEGKADNMPEWVTDS
ncbi:MAG: TolB family protein, partial [Planctomycetota bacterium]